MNIVLALLIGLIIGYGMGWRAAHITVAEECELLGRFFVGKKVYECTRILEAGPNPKVGG